MDYMEFCYDKFKDCKFELVNFDNGATPESMQCYLLVSNLNKELLKDKGTTVLDLGNYIFRRFGFSYEMPPEYHRRGEAADSVAFYQSKKKFNSIENHHIREWILGHDEAKKRPESVLYERRKLEIPNLRPHRDYVALWCKTDQLVILRKSLPQLIIFEADGNEFRYIQAELGPESDFEIMGEL